MLRPILPLTVIALLGAGCVAPAGETGPGLPQPLALVVTHEGCSLQIAFFGLPVDAARARLPAGFEPALQQDALGRETARSFVAAYGCADATIDDVPTGAAVAEMGFALAVLPPEALAHEKAGHWVITQWITNDAAVAAVYEAWGMGTLGEVTRASMSPAGEAGQHVTRATLGSATHEYTSRNTPGVVALPEDPLRLFLPRADGGIGIVDLVVEATSGGTGLATYAANEDTHYPATSLQEQGFHEDWAGRAWTFTLVDMGLAPRANEPAVAAR